MTGNVWLASPRKMLTNNVWLACSNARKIAAELQTKYFGVPYGPVDDPIEDQILNDLWNHPLNSGEMFLNIHWDDDNCLLWLQIGISGGDLVPR